MPGEEKMVDIPFLAEYLSVPASTIYRYLHDERDPLPSYRVGKHWRFRLSEVEAWLQHEGSPARGPGRSGSRSGTAVARGIGNDEGFSDEQLRDLEAIGVTTQKDFVRFATDPKKRPALIKVLGIPEALVDSFAIRFNKGQ